MDCKARELREGQILDLQKLAVHGIYPCGGTYRDARDHITISQSQHKPPDAAFVRSHMLNMIEWINQAKAEGVSALDRAAFALWRLNWIHPFRGGNGRTSRCVAYLILAMDMECMPPGVPSLPTLIYRKRDAYIAALQDADASVRLTGEPDLSTMNAYLQQMMTHQLASAIASLKTTTKPSLPPVSAPPAAS